MTRPKLSVLLPNYNHADFVGRAVAAILEQGYEPLELVIVDDGSTDGSRPLLEGLAARHPEIRLLFNDRNRGAKHSVRRAFEESSGAYVYSASADDRVLPGFFTAAIDLCERHPQAAYVSGNLVAAYPDGTEKEFGITRWSEPRYASPEEFLRDYLEVELPSHSLSAATVYRRDALASMMEVHSEALRAWSDSFRLRALGLRHGMCYLARPGVAWRVAEGSLSQEQGRRPRRVYDQIATAAALMRTPPFRADFPEDHVRRWEARYREQVLSEQVYLWEKGATDAFSAWLLAVDGSVPPRGSMARVALRFFKVARRICSASIRRRLGRYPGKVASPDR